MLWKQLFISNHERILVTINQQFAKILTPGEYFLSVCAPRAVSIETYTLADCVFDSPWTDFLLRERPDVIAEHFTMIETGESEIAVISVGGRIHTVLHPGCRILFWRDAAVITAAVFDFLTEAEVPKAWLGKLQRWGCGSFARIFSVPQMHLGVVYFDSLALRILEPGQYGFWTCGGTPDFDLIDLRIADSEPSKPEASARQTTVAPDRSR